METCEAFADVLSFVHLVEEKENQKKDASVPTGMFLDSDGDDESDSNRDSEDGGDDKEFDSSSDEEMEF